MNVAPSEIIQSNLRQDIRVYLFQKINKPIHDKLISITEKLLSFDDLMHAKRNTYWLVWDVSGQFARHIGNHTTDHLFK